jgi:hypothetical protein
MSLSIALSFETLWQTTLKGSIKKKHTMSLMAKGSNRFWNNFVSIEACQMPFIADFIFNLQPLETIVTSSIFFNYELACHLTSAFPEVQVTMRTSIFCIWKNDLGEDIWNSEGLLRWRLYPTNDSYEIDHPTNVSLEMASVPWITFGSKCEVCSHFGSSKKAL